MRHTVCGRIAKKNTLRKKRKMKLLLITAQKSRPGRIK
jgi:hypothetical protein